MKKVLELILAAFIGSVINLILNFLFPIASAAFTTVYISIIVIPSVGYAASVLIRLLCKELAINAAAYMTSIFAPTIVVCAVIAALSQEKHFIAAAIITSAFAASSLIWFLILTRLEKKSPPDSERSKNVLTAITLAVLSSVFPLLLCVLSLAAIATYLIIILITVGWIPMVVFGVFLMEKLRKRLVDKGSLHPAAFAVCAYAPALLSGTALGIITYYNASKATGPGYGGLVNFIMCLSCTVPTAIMIIAGLTIMACCHKKN